MTLAVLDQDDDHGAGGAGDLYVRSAEDYSEHGGNDGGDEACLGAHTRADAEPEGEGNATMPTVRPPTRSPFQVRRRSW